MRGVARHVREPKHFETGKEFAQAIECGFHHRPYRELARGIGRGVRLLCSSGCGFKGLRHGPGIIQRGLCRPRGLAGVGRRLRQRPLVSGWGHRRLQRVDTSLPAYSIRTKYGSSSPLREAGLMLNRDKVDWEAAYAMQDRDKMFLLYAVSEGLCRHAGDFSVHFDGAVEEEVQQLVGAGFLMESDGRLDVTERG